MTRPAPDLNPDLASAIGHARAALRESVITHRRSLEAHRRAQRRSAEALQRLEEQCEQAGLTLVRKDDTDQEVIVDVREAATANR